MGKHVLIGPPFHGVQKEYLQDYFIRWKPLFVIIVMFNLLYSWCYETEHYHCSEWCFINCNRYSLFIINKTWKWTGRTYPKPCWKVKKKWIYQISCAFCYNMTGDVFFLLSKNFLLQKLNSSNKTISIKRDHKVFLDFKNCFSSI